MKQPQVKTSWEEIGWHDMMEAPDGSRALQPVDGGRYCHFFMDDEDESSPMISLSEYPAGVERPPHSHETDYVEIVLAGSEQVSGEWLYAGDIRLVRAGTGYGPLIAGPEGSKVLVIFRHGNERKTIPKGAARNVEVQPAFE